QQVDHRQAQPLRARPAFVLRHRRPRGARRQREGGADEEGQLSMAFGTQDETDDVMNEINMTPLVDVMLVLLIIFIITVPVMKHAVNIDLPQATNQKQDIKPETIRLAVDAQGRYWWNE